MPVAKKLICRAERGRTHRYDDSGFVDDPGIDGSTDVSKFGGKTTGSRRSNLRCRHATGMCVQRQNAQAELEQSRFANRLCIAGLRSQQVAARIASAVNKLRSAQIQHRGDSSELLAVFQHRSARVIVVDRHGTSAT